MAGSMLAMKDAAARLGVHYMTVYRYVRLGMLPATKHGASWAIDEADLESFQRERSEPAPASEPGRRRIDWTTRLYNRLVAGDEPGSWGVVEAALTAGMSPSDVYTDMLAPALHEVGDRWERGDIGIAEEHRASSVAGRVVGRLGPRFVRRGRSRGTIVTATPAGDLHGLAVGMLADLFRGAGYDVIDLGANVPAESLESTVAGADRLVAVAISATNDSAAHLAESVAAARRGGGDGVPVIVGGLGVGGEEGAAAAGADLFAADADTALDYLDDRS